MKNMTVAILESHKVYGERLAAYISRKEGSPFRVSLYLEHPVVPERLKEADVVMMTSSLMNFYEECLEKQCVLVLDEDGREDMEETLYKYQSASVIYQTLLEFGVERSGKKLLSAERMKKEFEIVVIHTPVRGEKMEKGVLELCRKLGEGRQLLYLNLEPFSLFYEFLGHSDQQEGLSELVYYVKQGHKNLGGRLGQMIIKGDIDYLLPAGSPFDVTALNGEEWRFCMEHIRRETNYEGMVLDYGTGIPETGVLELCSKILLVRGDTVWEQRMNEAVMDWVGRVSEENFNEKTEEVILSLSE